MCVYTKAQFRKQLAKYKFCKDECSQVILSVDLAVDIKYVYIYKKLEQVKNQIMLKINKF